MNLRGRSIFILSFPLLFVGCTMDFTLVEGVSRLPTPVIESISPAIVEDAASVTFKLSGKNFSGISNLSIASQTCDLQVQSDSYMECTVDVDAQSDIANISYKMRNETQEVVVAEKELPTARRTIVLGQDSLYSVSKGLTKGMNYPTAVTKINNKLYIAVRGNCRILVLNAAPTGNYPDFNSFIGQEDEAMQDCVFERLRKRQTVGPITDLHSDGQKMVTADGSNNRILVWNTIPTQPMQAANVVLGQANFDTNTANLSGVSAKTLSNPQSARIHAGKLFVADTGNNRVLIWNTIPMAHNVAADVIIGQVDAITNTVNQGSASPTASSLSAPEFADVVDGNLVISDSGNHRLLIFEGVPTATNTAAKYVLGQADFVTISNAAGSTTDKTFKRPLGFAYDGQKFYLADNGNNRVLVWNSLPAQDYVAADMVVGQALFTTSTLGVTQNRFYTPKGVSVYDGLLYVTDASNYRVMAFDVATLATNANALYVLGQPDFVSRLTRNPNSDLGMVNPTSAFSDGQKLVAVDYGKNRVLLWDNLPTTTNAAPDFVLGQADLTTYGTATGATGLRSPFDAIIVGSKLIVSDNGNNRVLIWNSWPTANQQAADVVIGQANFTSVSANKGVGTPTASSLSAPRGLYSDGQNLIVTDFGNHRILIFNDIPTSNEEAADVVIGQADFSGKTAGLSDTQLNSPQRAKVIDNKLFIADRGNSRTLIYNTVPTTNGAAASQVLGQMDFTTTPHYSAGYTNPSVFTTVDLDSDNGNLKILTTEDRILSYVGIPLTPLIVPTIDFGTAPLMTNNPQGISGMQGSFSLQIVNGMYIIGDYANNRVLLVK